MGLKTSDENLPNVNCKIQKIQIPNSNPFNFYMCCKYKKGSI